MLNFVYCKHNKFMEMKYTIHFVIDARKQQPKKKYAPFFQTMMLRMRQFGSIFFCSMICRKASCNAKGECSERAIVQSFAILWKYQYNNKTNDTFYSLVLLFKVLFSLHSVSYGDKCIYGFSTYVTRGYVRGIHLYIYTFKFEEKQIGIHLKS